jgi:putative hemolysin
LDIYIIITFIISFFILLILSGFFSASETAFFSLSHAEIDRLKKKKDFQSRQASHLLNQPQHLLITIIIGNTIVNISAASISALFTIKLCGYLNFDTEIGILIEVVVVTLVILIFTEITPKVAAVKNAKIIALKFSFILTLFSYLLLPIVSIMHQLTHWLSHVFKIDIKKSLLSEEELRSLVDFSEEKGALQKDEKEMIHSIFEFRETTVKEIMVPRIDMVCVSTDTDIQTLLNTIKKNLHSRIPLYKDRIDNIVGIIYAKDLLGFINKPDSVNINLEQLAKPAYFVPEPKKIDELLREFQNEKIHMAIVVDEYGGTAGLVTLEDIIEEIVGEIQDEYDTEQPQYKVINENEFIVDGGMDLEEINEALSLDLPTEEGVETLAGFLFGLFGSVPKQKEIAVYKEYEFYIEKVFRRRITQVRIKKKKIAKI